MIQEAAGNVASKSPVQNDQAETRLYESPVWLRLGYALGTSGISVGSTPINMLLLYYLTEVVGLPAGLAGIAIALPKVWDAIIDPAFGGWVDRTAIRTKRRGPIVVASGTAFVISLMLIFCLPHLPSSIGVASLVTALLIVSSTSQTGFNVSQYALASEMTSNSKQLGGLLSLAGIVSQIFTIAAVALTPLLINWSGNGARGYVAMAIELAIVASILLTLFLLATQRVPVRDHGGHSGDLSLWDSLKSTIQNRPFYFLIGFLVFQGIGTAIVFAFLPFANQYVLGGSAGSLSVLEVTLFGAVMGGMFLPPLLLRITHTVRAMRWSNSGMMISMFALFAASFGPLWCTWCALAAAGIAAGAAGIFLQTAILEVSELKLRGGIVVASGFYLGIMVAGTKLGMSAGGFVSGELLDMIGFVAGAAHQASATLQWLRLGYTVVPLLFVAAAGILLRFVRLPPRSD